MFLCPKCAASSLIITSQLELDAAPPYYDERTAHTVKCLSCGFLAVAAYKETRWPDRFWHTGYFVTPDQVQAAEALIGKCPSRHDSNCECPAHKQMNDGESGWPQTLNPTGSFKIVREAQ
jgi:hypothetical protein